MDAVRAWPLLIGEQVTTVGARLDDTVLASLYGVSAPPGGLPGRWVCEAADADTSVGFEIRIGGLVVGPRWRLDSQPEGALQPPEPVPLNLAARVVMGLDAAPENLVARARDAIARCRASNGVWVTTGAFIIIAEQGTVDPSTLRWSLVPGDAANTAEASLGWSQGGTPMTATWRVDVDAVRCEPLDEQAAEALAAAMAVPRDSDLSLRPPGRAAQLRPSAERDPGRRALEYVLAETRELDTIEAWLSYGQRVAPVEIGPWLAEAPGRTTPGSAGVSVVRQGDELWLRWFIDPVSFSTEPTSTITRLARAVLPRRIPGPGDAVLRPSSPPPETVQRAIDAVGPDIASCLERVDANRVDFRFKVQWDGYVHAPVVELPPREERLAGSCIRGVIEQIQLDAFAGPVAEVGGSIELP